MALNYKVTLQLRTKFTYKVTNISVKHAFKILKFLTNCFPTVTNGDGVDLKIKFFFKILGISRITASCIIPWKQSTCISYGIFDDIQVAMLFFNFFILVGMGAVRN